jgi:hypothetical protein
MFDGVNMYQTEKVGLQTHCEEQSHGDPGFEIKKAKERRKGPEAPFWTQDESHEQLAYMPGERESRR